MKTRLSTNAPNRATAAARQMIHKLGLAFGGLFLTIALALPGQASTVLYDQPWDNGAGGVLASQNDTTSLGNFATVYDNFHFGPAPAPGRPGNPIVVEHILGDGNETSHGIVNGIPTYSYDLMGLGSIFLAPNAQYWISLVPDLGFPPQWGWSTGTGGEGLSYQAFFGNISPQNTDMAFTLLGNGTHLDEVKFFGGYFNPNQQGTITAWTVTLYNDIPATTPEPGTFLLLGSGILGLGGMLRRRLIG